MNCFGIVILKRYDAMNFFSTIFAHVCSEYENPVTQLNKYYFNFLLHTSGDSV